MDGAYRWRDWTFAPPAQTSDRSFLLFIDESAARPLSATFTVDDKGAELAGYVDEAVRELAARLAGFRVALREERTVDGRRALVVEQSARAEDGAPVLQRQAFVDDGAEVIIATVTGHPDDAVRVRAAFDALLASLHKPATTSPQER